MGQRIALVGSDLGRGGELDNLQRHLPASELNPLILSFCDCEKCTQYSLGQQKALEYPWAEDIQCHRN